MTEPKSVLAASQAMIKVTARALLLGDRIDAAGLERSDMISATPLAFHVGTHGFVAFYRFGVAVMIGLSPLEEDDVLNQVKLRVTGTHESIDDETAILEIAPEHDDKIEKVKGLTVTICTTARSDSEGKALLRALGMPFRS